MMEKVSVVFSILMIPFIPGMWRIHGWLAWFGFLVIDKWKLSKFQTKKHMGSTLGWGWTKLTMGGNGNNCKGTKYSAVQRICMQSEAYKTCEGWVPLCCNYYAIT